MDTAGLSHKCRVPDVLRRKERPDHFRRIAYRVAALGVMPQIIADDPARNMLQFTGACRPVRTIPVDSKITRFCLRGFIGIPPSSFPSFTLTDADIPPTRHFRDRAF